jgi:hypothetical protein
MRKEKRMKILETKWRVEERETRERERLQSQNN